MSTYADKTQKNKSQSVSAASFQMQSVNKPAFQFVDNRPEAITQRKLQVMANNKLRGITGGFSGHQQSMIQRSKNTPESISSVQPPSTIIQRIHSTPSARLSVSGPKVIQMILPPVPYKTSYQGPLNAYKSNVNAIVTMLNQRVDQAYQQALQWQTLAHNPDPLVQRWYEIASAYAQNPDKEPRIIHARFGYAIESLACQGLNNTQHNGLNISTQVAHGHTRPDMVASIPNGPEVAWLDITSAGSIGHIEGKEGAGWDTRPFIYEIVYPKLQLRDLLNATDDPYFKEYGELLADERQIELNTKLDRQESLRKRFIALRDTNGWTTGTGNAAEKRKITRDDFMNYAASEGVEEDTQSMVNTRGALENLDINPGPYGFNRGDVKSSAERLNQVMDAASLEEIKLKQGQLSASTTFRIMNELKNSPLPKPLFEKLYSNFYVDPASRHTTLTAMALKGMTSDLPKIDQAQHHLIALGSTDGRVTELRTQLEQQKAGPATASHDQVVAWRTHTQALIQQSQGLIQVIQASNALYRYAVKQNFNMFNRPLFITQWFQQLAANQPNVQVAKTVMQWLLQQEHQKV